MTTEEKRKQVSEQCRAVAHLATALAQVHTDFSRIMLDPSSDGIVEQVGARTAAWMERLGDMLNAIDAGDESDEWLTPIFEEAQHLWPQKQEAAE